MKKDQPSWLMPLLLIVVIALGSFLFRGCNRNRVPSQIVDYRCSECDHVWNGGMAFQATCPLCKELAARDAFYRCDPCGHEFSPWTVKRIGVGESRYRMAGTDEWVGRVPENITCPSCQHEGGLEPGPFKTVPPRRSKKPSKDPVVIPTT